jgi:hypothetical protein
LIDIWNIIQKLKKSSVFLENNPKIFLGGGDELGCVDGQACNPVKHIIGNLKPTKFV